MKLGAAFVVLILGAACAGNARAGDDTDVDKLLDALGRPAPEVRPEAKVAFPPIADWGSLRITLERRTCFWGCPIYKVEIRGDGTVLYDGSEWVA